jgi:hypothetical protein
MNTFRFWPLADISFCTANARVREQRVAELVCYATVVIINSSSGGGDDDANSGDEGNTRRRGTHRSN